MVVFGTTVLDRWFEKNLKFFSEAKATVLPHGSGGTVWGYSCAYFSGLLMSKYGGIWDNSPR